MQRMWNMGDETSCFGEALICTSVKQLGHGVRGQAEPGTSHQMTQIDVTTGRSEVEH